MRPVARHKKAMTRISQRSLSKILRLLSKTYPIPWIEVLSEKSSVVFSKVAFPLILAHIPSPGGSRCRIGMDEGWRKSLTVKAVIK